uniref:Chitin-binding type-2 domain-containing protein n=1 Tax=Strigamia maritima TaxID=126957 RepID=T1J4M7_STRMM
DFPTLFYPGSNRQLVTLAPHEIPVSTSSPLDNHIGQPNDLLPAQNHVQMQNFDESQVQNIENNNQVQVVYIRPGSDQSSSLFDVVQGFQDKPLESLESQSAFRNVQNNGRRPHFSMGNNHSPKALRPYPLRLRLQDLVSPPVQSQVEPAVHQVAQQVQQQFDEFQPEEMIVPQEFKFEENQEEFNNFNQENNGDNNFNDENNNFNQQNSDNNNFNQQNNDNNNFNQQNNDNNNFNHQNNDNNNFNHQNNDNNNFFQQNNQFQQFTQDNQQFFPSTAPPVPQFIQIPTQTPPPKLPRLPWNIPQRRPHSLDIDDSTNQQFPQIEQQFAPQEQSNDLQQFPQQFPQHPQEFIENENANDAFQFVDNHQNIGTSAPLTNDLSVDNFFRSSGTNFSCKNQQFPGYYADIQDGCQTFHVCYGGSHFSFQCPSGTLFDQKYLVCNWPHDVNCNSSPDFYHVNSIFVDQRYDSKK